MVLIFFFFLVLTILTGITINTIPNIAIFVRLLLGIQLVITISTITITIVITYTLSDCPSAETPEPSAGHTETACTLQPIAARSQRPALVRRRP